MDAINPRLDIEMPSLVQDVLAPQVSVLFQSLVGAGSLGRKLSAFQVILPTAPGTSNEGRSSPVLVPLPAVSWPWVPAWGSLEPSRRGGENAQKTRKSGKRMGGIWPKKCEPRELTKTQLAGPWATSLFGRGSAAGAWFSNLRVPFTSSIRITLQQAIGRPDYRNPHEYL